MKKFFKSIKFKYGAISIVITAFFIVGVIILNVIAGILTERYYLRADLTSAGLYELSDETVEMLASLPENVTIKIMAKKEGYDPEISEVLMKYKALSGGKLDVQYVDPYLNPQEAAQYGAGEDVSGNDVVVVGSKRFSRIKYEDLYEYTVDYQKQTKTATAFSAEQRITSAIMYALSSKIPKALSVNNHGEPPNDELGILLMKANFEIGGIDLLRESIPEDCSMLIINSPAQDFTGEELNKLDEFFDRGGNAMISKSISGGGDTPTLNLYLEEWGVRYRDGLIVDSQMYITSPVNIIGAFTANGITSGFPVDSFAVNLGAMPIERLWSENGGRRTTTLIVTSGSSYEKISSEKAPISSYEKAQGDASGPFAIAVLAEQQRETGGEPIQSRVLFYCSELAGKTGMENSAAFNRRFFLSAASYMNEVEDPVVIEPRAFESGQLSVEGMQGQVIFMLLVVVLPLLILTAGIAVWVRRRHM